MHMHRIKDNIRQHSTCKISSGLCRAYRSWVG